MRENNRQEKKHMHAANISFRKPHHIHGQMLPANEIMVKKRIKDTNNRNAQDILRKQMKGNSTGVYWKDWKEEGCHKKVREDENGLELERIITDELLLISHCLGKFTSVSLYCVPVLALFHK